jgi:hypothetical protein
MKRSRMRFSVWATDAVALAMALLLFVTAADAQDDLPDVSSPCAPEVVATRSLLLPHGGQAGMWFHIDVARCMLSRLEALPLYAARVRLLEQRLVLSDERHGLMVRQVALAEEGERRAEGVLVNAERRARSALAGAETERNLRWLWFGVGVVLTALVQALAIWALGELS